MQAGPLREARLVVAPRIPELAPQLRRDPSVIQSALVSELGYDAPEAALNKLERYTMATFVIGALRKELVVGYGMDINFRRVSRTMYSSLFPEQPMFFRPDIRKTFRLGARKVCAQYTRGKTPEERWWPLAQRRYAQLGHAMAKLATVSGEGMNFRLGLRGGALGGQIEALCGLLVTYDMMPDKRWAASHDLAGAVTSGAGVHLAEFLTGSKAVITPRDTITRITRTDADSGVVTARYIRRPAPRPSDEYKPSILDADPTLKCPAHVITDPDGEDTNLTDFVHAALNMAYEYDLMTGRGSRTLVTVQSS